MRVLCLAVVLGVAAAAYTPVTSLLVTRHGARAPYLFAPNISSKIGQWDCAFSLFEYPGVGPVSSTQAFDNQLYRKTYIAQDSAATLLGNCSQGQLTNTGAEMLRSTGQWLRDKLDGFLPETWDDSRMYARSTDIDRTYESAENLLQTLFPVPQSSTPGIASIINIWTVEKGLDVVDVAVNAPCPALVNKCAEIARSQEWQDRFQQNQALIEKLAVAFGVPVSDVPDIALVFDVLRATKAQGLNVAGINDDIYNAVEEASSWELKALYENETVHQFTSSQLVKMIRDVIVDAAGGSGRVFTLFSAHDTTIAPLLSALQIPWSVWPQYAANLYFGLLRDEQGNFFVEVLHDRKSVSLAGQPSPVPLAQFLNIAAQSILPDRQQACYAGQPRSSRKRRSVDPEIGYLCGSG